MGGSLRGSALFAELSLRRGRAVGAGRGASAACGAAQLAASRSPPGTGEGKPDPGKVWAARPSDRTSRGRQGGDGGEAGEGSSRAQVNMQTCVLCFVLFLARYWEDFHSCTVTALTDCQEGAKDMWDKLRKESKNLNIQGSLFELCGSGNGAAGPLLPAVPLLLASLSAALATWLPF